MLVIFGLGEDVESEHANLDSSAYTMQRLGLNTGPWYSLLICSKILPTLIQPLGAWPYEEIPQ